MTQSIEVAMTPEPDDIENDDDMIVAEEDSSGEPANDDSNVIALEDKAQQKRLIEALLFASPEPISLRSIQNRLPDSADVGGILLELQAEYETRGVNLVRMEDVWAFRTAADVGPYLALAKKEEKKLSRAALETLSIIAYHQPVTRAEVENIRGVATSKGTLDVLLEAGWIKPGRRRETPGRPVTWITTTNFLDEFGIANLNDLPGLQELKASGLLDTRPAIETIPGAADLFSASEEGQSSEENSEDADDTENDEDEIAIEIESEIVVEDASSGDADKESEENLEQEERV
jgi:segregation and condensation protein B